MDRWEYRFVQAYGTVLDEINQLGQQGWEAVGSTGASNILLKRKIPSSPTQTIQKPQVNNDFDDFGIRF